MRSKRKHHDRDSEIEALRRRVSELESAQTGLRQTEEALRESEARYRGLVENFPMGLFRTTPGPEGKVVMANPAAARMLGCDSVAELLGAKAVWTYQSPADRGAFSEKLIAKGRVIAEELRLKKKDGTPMWVAVTARVVRNESGEVEYFEGMLDDVTDRKRAEEELKNYQFMVESAHDAIFFKDLESRYVIANAKTLEAFGLSRGEVIGKNDSELLTDREEAGKNVEDDQRVFSTGEPAEITKHMTGADGKERWFQAIKTPRFDDSGNIVGLVGIARDITERKKAAEALRVSEQQYRTLVEDLPLGIYRTTPTPKQP